MSKIRILSIVVVNNKREEFSCKETVTGLHGNSEAYYLPYRICEFWNIPLRKAFVIAGLAKCTDVQVLLMKEK
jgi:hypothetical protein